MNIAEEVERSLMRQRSTDSSTHWTAVTCVCVCVCVCKCVCVIVMSSDLSCQWLKLLRHCLFCFDSSVFSAGSRLRQGDGVSEPSSLTTPDVHSATAQLNWMKM